MKELYNNFGIMTCNELLNFLEDYKNGTEFIETFEKELKEKESDQLMNERKIDISFQIFNQSIWKNKVDHLKICDMPLPQDINESLQQFTQFFNSHFSRKRLIFSNQLSTVEMQINNSKNIFVMTCPTKYAIVLLQFNEKNSYSLKELSSKLLIPEDEMYSILSTLSSSQVDLLKHKNDLYHLENNDKNENISIPIQIQSSLISAEFELKNIIRQQYQIECQLIQIIKTNDGLDANQIIEKIMNSIQSFSITEEFIFQHLDILVQKSFLSLDSTGIYHFIP